MSPVGFSFDPAVIVLIAGRRGALRARRSRRLRGARLRRAGLAAGGLARRDRAHRDRPAVADRRAGRGAALGPHGPAPADRRPGRAVPARRACTRPCTSGSCRARPPWRSRAAALRPLFRKLRRPLVAIAIWVADPLRLAPRRSCSRRRSDNDLLHALQHQTFVLGAVLIWWPVIEPKRRRAARRAVEDRPHPRRAAGRHVPRDGLHLIMSLARLRGLLRRRRPRARPLARSPTSRSPAG